MQQEDQQNPNQHDRPLEAEDFQQIPPAKEGENVEKQSKLEEDTQKRRAILLRRQFDLNEEDYKFDADEGKDLNKLNTNELMKLSGMVHATKPSSNGKSEEDYWPEGIKQTGAVPIVNLYGNEPFGRSLPEEVETIQPVMETPLPIKVKPIWKVVLNHPATKVSLGLLVGIGMLLLIAKIVDIPATIAILKARLTTPQGIGFALLSGVAFLAAFSIRGVRWKLFLNPIGKVSTLKAVQLFLVGIFLNFLLPIRGGEVAKSLMLKRIANIPISQSLPTVAMDKALDLMPALFIMALVPLLGVSMDIKLWLVLAAVSGLLICLIFFIILAAWKRTAAISLLQKLTAVLPKSLANKVEDFATGFVDSLLAGASQPKIFIPAILLTIVAVMFDGLFALFAFATVGVSMSFGTAIFGYTVYNMFYILPTPPGQVGSNEVIGLLIFAGLLHFPTKGVTAMFIFSHPWAALLMCVSGMLCLSALGLTVSSAMGVGSGAAEEKKKAELASSAKPMISSAVEPLLPLQGNVALSTEEQASKV
jgi:uncharacterized protein (TIRG00374 family)